jgi:outer membrane autotransporter protein
LTSIELRRVLLLGTAICALTAGTAGVAWASATPDVGSDVTITGSNPVSIGSSIDGSLLNTGSISSNTLGVQVWGGIGGNLVNSGSISGYAGIFIGGSVVGGLSNTGTIIGSSGYGIYTGGDVGGNVYDGGVIRTSGIGIEIGGNVAGGITIAAGTTISTSRGYGVRVDNGLTALGGGGSGVGVVVGTGGGLSNSGTITSGGNTGISIGGGTGGSISNTGTITSGGGVGITFGGGGVVFTIVNGGTIAGGTVGETFVTAGVLPISENPIVPISGVSLDQTGNVGSGIVAGGSENGGATVSIGALDRTIAAPLAVISSSDTGIYVGGTIGGGLVNNGVIESDPNHAAVKLDWGGLDLVNTGTIVGGNGIALDYSQASAPSTITQAGGLIQGAIQLSSNQNDVLDITGGTIAGAIEGAGATVNIAGNFTSDGSMDVGAIDVLNGRFILADDVTVARGLTNDAVLEIRGLRTITGDFTQGPGATLAVEIGADGPGELVVSHDVTMAAPSTIVLVEEGASPITAPQTVTIVSAGNSADYSGVGFGGNPFLGLAVSPTIVGKNMVVTLTPDETANVAGTATLAGSPNGQSVAATLTQLFQTYGPNNPAGPSVLSAINRFFADTSSPLTETQKIQLVAQQLVPQSATVNAETTQQFSSAATTAVVQHVQTARDAEDSAERGVAAGSASQDSAFWGQLLGFMARRDSDADTAGDQVKTVGAAFGADTLVTPRLRLGGSFAYGKSFVDGLDSAAGTSSHIDSYQISGYGSYDGGPWYVDGQIGIGLSNYNQSRSIGFLAVPAKADYDGTAVSAHVDGGYDFALGRTRLTPIAALTYTHQETDAYTESGTGDAIAGAQSDSAQTELGAEAHWKIPLAAGRLEPSVRLGWLHDWIRSPLVTTATLGGTSFVTTSTRPTADGFDLGLAATFYSLGDWQIQGQYDGNFYHGYTSHAGIVNLKLSF